MLSGRRNIVVIADEAHRSQYDFIDGFARHLRDALPNASFIGFTGTPIELTDKNTRAVFGDYISIYDIQRAVQDGATVPIYYEGRMAKLELDEQERPYLDEEFEEATEGEEVDRKEKLKTKWAALEAIVGTKKRIGLIAQDLVDHYALRLEAMEGKAMVVCMSRRICVDLYNAITKLRPDWHDEDDAKGTIKIVMTGSVSDPLEWQQHVRNKPRREGLAKRFKDPKDPMKVVLVRDMWLTGFDAPSLHTMYVDKPMRGHGLMQAIARVNRVFRDKPGGLVVDYLGLADHLRRALAVYTESGGEGSTAIDQNEAVAVMLEKYEICYALFHGFDWSFWITGKPAERISLIPAAQEHILAQEDGKPRLLKAVTELSRSFALAVPHEKALRIRDDVSFFQAVRAAIAKSMVDGRRSPEEIEQAIQQIVSKAITTEQIVDIFAAAGLKKPDLSILSDEFLAEVRGMPHRNLAVELLRKLLSGEIKTRSRKNLVQSKSFSEMLERTLRAYQNRAIETAQVIEELIALAREMRAADRRGEKLGLAEEEVAFYDALETNDSAVQVLGDETLRTIARELVVTVRNNITIDWTVKESVRAKLRIMVKRVLRKHGYPPDKEEQATRTVLEQAELLGRDWAEEAVPARDARAEAVPSDVLPFRRVTPREEDKYRTCVPLLSLKAAAGAFGDVQTVEPDGWAEIPLARKLRPGMFVAQVVGRSLEPRVPDGAWCLFRGPVEGSRQGRTVLVQHRDIQDPETGGSYTVKRYRSGKASDGMGGWRHTEIRLDPENPEFAPIVLTEAREDEVRVVAELIQVLG